MSAAQSRQHFRFGATIAFLLAFSALLPIGPIFPAQDYALCSSPAGKIYTVDPAYPNVECIVVSNTTITDAGSLSELEARNFSWLSDRISLYSGYQGSLAQPSCPRSSRRLSIALATEPLAAFVPYIILGSKWHRCPRAHRFATQ